MHDFPTSFPVNNARKLFYLAANFPVMWSRRAEKKSVTISRKSIFTQVERAERLITYLEDKKLTATVSAAQTVAQLAGCTAGCITKATRIAALSGALVM
jgi:hypothetical protein